MILYITRKFPPSIGGMQRFNQKLVSQLKTISELYLIKWGGSQVFLPFFLLYAFLRGAFACATKPISVIYVSDGLLSPLGLILKWVTRKPVVANIHGRDIAFDLTVYQIIIPRSLRRMDKVICVSEGLKQECIKRNVPESKLHVIPNGVDAEDFKVDAPKLETLERLVNATLSRRKILVTVGRLVPKKGVHSFLKNIFPKVLEKHPTAAYIIIGDGPLEAEIRRIIEGKKYQDNVYLTGRIAMEGGLLPEIYNLADVFVMPNIPVPDDMEGFGIVAIEAGAAGLPVVASNVDGIVQAIANEENGFLLRHNDYTGFAQKISELLSDPDRCKKFGRHARQYVTGHYSWRSIAGRYLDQFKAVARPGIFKAL